MVDPNVRRNFADSSPPVPPIGTAGEDEDILQQLLISDKNDHTLMSGDEEKEEEDKTDHRPTCSPSKTSLQHQKNRPKKIKTPLSPKKTNPNNSTKKKIRIGVSKETSLLEKFENLKRQIHGNSSRDEVPPKEKGEKKSSNPPRNDEEMKPSDRSQQDDVSQSSTTTKPSEKDPPPSSTAVIKKEKNREERNTDVTRRPSRNSFGPADSSNNPRPTRPWRPPPPPREPAFYRPRQFFQDSPRHLPYPPRSFENVHQSIQRSRVIHDSVIKAVFLCVVGDGYSISNCTIAITEDRCGPTLESFLIHDLQSFETLSNLFLVGHESMNVWNNIKTEFLNSVNVTFLDDRYSGTCAFCFSARCHKWNVVVSGLQKMTRFTIQPLDH